jgi:surface carbohydrate biosynthesis protein (TIGR04326 family)
VISHNIHSVLIWDSEGSPPASNFTNVLWRGLVTAESVDSISIPALIEENADALRARYLAWIYGLGERKINNRRLIEHLEIRPGFSYWWMSSLAQKANLSPTSLVNDSIKLLELNNLVTERKITSITLMSSNQRLAESIHALCQKCELRYEWRRIKDSKKTLNTKKLNRLFSLHFRAFIYFFWYIFKMTPALLKKTSIDNSAAGKITFVDMLVHLGSPSLSTGRFVTNYWGELVEKLSEWKVKSNWVHNYFRHSNLSSPNAAIKLIKRFSSSSNGLQTHWLTEQYLSFASLYKAGHDYFNIRKKFIHLKSLSEIQSQDCESFLWPLHTDEWHDSLCGKQAIKNCITLSLVESAITSIPHQKIGVYIQENQPWEIALIYAWNSSGHGILIGAPHTVIRYWDLRYYFDPRIFQSNGNQFLPFPDLVAVNGPVAKENLLASGYPYDRIKEVEALRYLHLLRSLPRNEPNGHVIKKKRVLICGDFRVKSTQQMLALLENAEALSPTQNTYIFKPHPAYDIKAYNYSKLKMSINTSPIENLLAQCDLVFASNSTSAAVDAYCLGIPVIQMLEDGQPNLSPLRGMPNIIDIKNSVELAKELKNPGNIGRKRVKSYFYLNESLWRWKKLLEISR